MTRQFSESLQYIQKWLVGVSVVVHEVFSMRQWLERSGIVSTLRNLFPEIQRFYTATGEIKAVGLWVAWWQDLDSESCLSSTREKGRPALQRPLPQAQILSIQAMLTHLASWGTHIVSIVLNRPQSSDVTSLPETSSLPDLAAIAVRKSTVTVEEQDDALPPISSDHSERMREICSPSYNEILVLDETTKAKYLANEAETLLEKLFPAACLVQKDSDITIVAEGNSHRTSLFRHNIVESLYRNAGQALDSAGVVFGPAPWEDREAVPEYEKAEFEVWQATSTFPQQDYGRADGIVQRSRIIEEMNRQLMTIQRQVISATELGPWAENYPLIERYTATEEGNLESTTPDRATLPLENIKIPATSLHRRSWGKPALPVELKQMTQIVEKINRQFNVAQPQVISATELRPWAENYPLIERYTATEEGNLESTTPDRATLPLENAKIPTTLLHRRSWGKPALPAELKQMTRITGDTHRQFNTIESQTRLLSDIWQHIHTSTQGDGTPSLNSPYPSQTDIQSGQLLSLRDMLFGLSDLVSQLVKEIKETKRGAEVQSEREVQSKLDASIETNGFAEVNLSAPGQILSKLLVEEARRYGINL